jgi:hypothetical protein
LAHNKHSPRWLARLGIVMVLALGVGLVPLFAQNYGSTSAKGTTPNSMSNSTAMNQTSSSQTMSNQVASNQVMTNQPVSRATEVHTMRNMVLKYWNAVAYRDTQKLDSDFAANAEVVWIGGQLDGTYKGQTAIDNLWSQFAGVAPLTTFQVKHIWYAVSGSQPTVSEDVVLTPLNGSGKPIHVSSTLVYNADNKIVREVWEKI